MANYALLSVSNKTGIVDFARSLVDYGYTIISSGGTHAVIQVEGIPVLRFLIILDHLKFLMEE